jgi:hypothetical protein
VAIVREKEDRPLMFLCKPLGVSNAIDPADFVKAPLGGSRLPVPDTLSDPAGNGLVCQRLLVGSGGDGERAKEGIKHREPE